MSNEKIIALVLNLIIPGLGTLIAGKKKEGTIQIIMAGVAFLLVFTIIGILIAVPLGLGALIWSEITVAKMDDSEFKKK